jgi:large subunit ribosomal protein L4
MASAPILGNESKKIELDGVAFGARFNGPLVHESVRAELAARRQGTHSTKTRGNVRGGGAKPWRQKGTGRARAGSSRSPIWTGGGTVFGPSPRSYTFKINRKERRAALRSALSVHAERGTIAVLDAGAFDAPSTKQAAGLVADWANGGSVLVVLAEEQARVALSFRNLARVSVLPAQHVGVADLIGAASLLITQEALDHLTARAKGDTRRSAPGTGNTAATEGVA